MNIRGAARIIVDDPRADGAVQLQGGAVDYWWDKERAEDFTFANTELLPEPFNAVILKRQFIQSHMSLTNWTFTDSTYYKLVRPPTIQSRRYVKFFNATALATGKATYTGCYEENPALAFFLIRSKPPEDETAYWVKYHVGIGGATSYRITIPKAISDGQERDPYLEKYDPLAPSAWTVVSRFSDAPGDVKCWSTDAVDEQVTVVHCIGARDGRKGYILIQFAGASKIWAYGEDDLNVSAGPVSIEHRGGALAYNVCEVGFSITGYVEYKHARNVATWINPTFTMDYLADETSATSVTVDPAEDPPRATLTTTNSRRTPILYRFTDIHAPTFYTVTDPNDLSDDGTVRSFSYHLKEDYRGNSVEFMVAKPNDATYAWKGNEKCTLEVAQDDGSGITWTKQFHGALEGEIKPTFDESEGVGRSRLQCSAQDTARLQRKKAIMYLDFSWRTFVWAFHYALNRAGVQDAWISIDEDDEFKFDEKPKWERFLTFDPDTDVAAVLDKLCQAHGNWEWGRGTDGKYFARSPVKTGASVYTIDDDNVDDDLLYSFEAPFDLSDLRNAIIEYTKDARGEPYIAVARSVPSMDDATKAYFLGDDWWEVLIREADNDALMTVEKELELRLTRQKMIEWETNAKPTLFPGQFVTVNASNVNIPAGTVFKIMEKRGGMSENDLEMRDKFVGAIVQ